MKKGLKEPNKHRQHDLMYVMGAHTVVNASATELNMHLLLETEVQKSKCDHSEKERCTRQDFYSELE